MSKVGPKGQVVINKHVRKQLGVQPGYLALQKLVDDHVEIRFLPPEHKRSLKGVLSPLVKKPAHNPEFSSIKQKAWSASIAKRRKAQGEG